MLPSTGSYRISQVTMSALACRYLIGLPLWQKNAIELSQQIMKDAQQYLGDALIGFELGNEVRHSH